MSARRFLHRVHPLHSLSAGLSHLDLGGGGRGQVARAAVRLDSCARWQGSGRRFLPQVAIFGLLPVVCGRLLVLVIKSLFLISFLSASLSSRTLGFASAAAAVGIHRASECVCLVW